MPNDVIHTQFEELPKIPSIPVYLSTTKDVTDGKLSLKAFALHTFIRGLREWWTETEPDKGPWVIYAEDLARRLHMSRNTIGKLLEELIAAGYIDRHRLKQGKKAAKGHSGLFGGYTYIVYCMNKNEWLRWIEKMTPQRVHKKRAHVNSAVMNS